MLALTLSVIQRKIVAAANGGKRVKGLRLSSYVSRQGAYMNYLWGGMIVIGVIFGAVHGGFGLITEAAVSSSKEAVNLAIAMA